MDDAWRSAPAAAGEGLAKLRYRTPQRGSGRGVLQPALAEHPCPGHRHRAASSCCSPQNQEVTDLLALHFICGSALSETEPTLGIWLESLNAAMCDRPEFW